MEMDEKTINPWTDTLLQSPDPGAGILEYSLQADFFAGQIDLRAFRARHPHYPVLGANPLVLEPERGRYAFLSRFGVLVAWNCPEVLVLALRADLQALPGVGPLAESATDRLKVVVGAETDWVGFDTVWLRELTLAQVRLISLLLAQSVALDHFDLDVGAALDRFQPAARALRTKGALPLGHGEVLKMVGYTMDVRLLVLANLALFDDPPETWENEDLDRLHRALYRQLDLADRLEALNRKLAYLKDAASTFMEALTSRTSHRMEWVIIILIFIETVSFLWKELLS